jgi:hypothetical protein
MIVESSCYRSFRLRRNATSTSRMSYGSEHHIWFMCLVCATRYVATFDNVQRLPNPRSEKIAGVVSKLALIKPRLAVGWSGDCIFPCPRREKSELRPARTDDPA